MLTWIADLRGLQLWPRASSLCAEEELYFEVANRQRRLMSVVSFGLSIARIRYGKGSGVGKQVTFTPLLNL